MRLDASSFESLERRFGPFTEWLGAERRLATRPSSVGASKIWMHPTFNTVGSALRLLGERLSMADGQDASGIVVVPHDEDAQWFQMV